MTRALLILLSVLPLLLTAQARDSTDGPQLQVGVGGGILAHEVSFTPTQPDQVPLSRNNYALLLRYFDNPLVGFQAEVGLMQAGWREDFSDSLRTAIYERRTDYLEVLLLTQLSPGRGIFQPLLQGGPFVSFPLSEEQDVPEGFFDPENSYYGRELPFRVNFGMQFGVGLNVNIGPVTLQLDGRYLLGFNDLIKTGEAGTTISRRQGIGGHVGVFYRIR